jgi:hypothetical protein
LIEADDDYVLYTDCDVMFPDVPPAPSCEEPFAIAPETEPDAPPGNTGVVLMNVRALRDSFPEFRQFIVSNLDKFVAFDPTAYQMFYYGQFRTLKPELNWRPYWRYKLQRLPVQEQ